MPHSRGGWLVVAAVLVIVALAVGFTGGTCSDFGAVDGQGPDCTGGLLTLPLPVAKVVFGVAVILAVAALVKARRQR